jgi:Bacterial PH domain
VSEGESGRGPRDETAHQVEPAPGSGDSDRGESGGAPAALVIRPLRVRWLAWISAVIVFGVMTASAVLLRTVSTGVYFRPADQVAMVLLGLLMALGMLTPTLARVRADAHGVEVRNLLVTRRLAWSRVLAVSFPDGARWARLELPDDEYLPVTAVQLVDGARAVTAMCRLRALHAAAQRRSPHGPTSA